jgi:hypothetical protein
MKLTPTLPEKEKFLKKMGYEISIVDASDGCQVTDIIPPVPELLVS